MNAKRTSDQGPSTTAQLRALGPLAPKIRFGYARPWTRAGELRRVLPFKRSWPAIIGSGVLFAIFCIPLVTVGAQTELEADGDRFSLTSNLFNAFWLLGWSVGVAVLGLAFSALLLGREVLIVRPGTLIVRIEILGLGISGQCDAAHIHNLRRAEPDERGGTGWRGAHLAFDYRGVTVDFGSNIVEPRAGELLARIRDAVVTTIPDGPAPAVSDEPAATPHEERDAAPPVDPEPSLTARRSEPVTFRSPSTIALILANLVPLAGAVLLGWDMGRIMILYWAESAIIGVFNLLKMAVIGKWAVLFLGPFFLGHYGGFMIGHLLFIYGFFIDNPAEGGSIPLSQVVHDFAVLWPALVALFASHAISFYLNFIGRAEYEGRKVSDQMGEPYKRIIVMHVTIIFGGFLVLALGSAVPALMLLITLKIAADVRAHLTERRARRLPES